MRTVGLLGGMGPGATVLLMQKVIDRVPAADDADHVPLLVDQNPQVPSRLRFLLEGRGEDPGPVLAAMARRLVGAGARALAMPCNTAHHWADAVRGAGVPFLDMVALASDRARALAGAGGRVGLLGSPALRRVGVYDAPMAARGLALVHPRDADGLVAAIRAVKAGDAGAGPRDLLRRAADDVAAQGAGVAVVACTEFSLLADALDGGTASFDALDALGDAVVDFARAGADQDRANGLDAAAPNRPDDNGQHQRRG